MTVGFYSVLMCLKQFRVLKKSKNVNRLQDRNESHILFTEVTSYLLFRFDFQTVVDKYNVFHTVFHKLLNTTQGVLKITCTYQRCRETIMIKKYVFFCEITLPLNKTSFKAVVPNLFNL